MNFMELVFGIDLVEKETFTGQKSKNTGGNLWSEDFNKVVKSTYYYEWKTLRTCEIYLVWHFLKCFQDGRKYVL